MEEELMYSDDAEANRYLFYTDINDINIFVEDKGKEYFYETIFKRMFNNEYRISSILAVGGKTNLEKIFKEFGACNKDDTGKKNVYIADGDFDRIIGRDMIDSNNFIYLFEYNIENYLIDEDATCIFAKGKMKMLDSEVKKELDFNEWKRKIVEQAFKLFILYSSIQKYNADIPNVNRGAYSFIDSRYGLEREGEYNKFYSEVKSKIDDLDDKVDEIKGIWESIYKDDKARIICGKFLFTSLCCHLRQIINKPFKDDDFLWNLIQHFDIRRLDYVKGQIEDIMIS